MKATYCALRPDAEPRPAPDQAATDTQAMLAAITADSRRMFFLFWVLIFLGLALIVPLLVAGVRP